VKRYPSGRLVTGQKKLEGAAKLSSDYGRVESCFCSVRVLRWGAAGSRGGLDHGGCLGRKQQQGLDEEERMPGKAVRQYYPLPSKTGGMGCDVGVGC